MNNPIEQQLEKLLRMSPRPMPPRGLKEKLIMQTSSDPNRSGSTPAVLARVQRSWFQRWWPVLVPAGFSLFCVAVLAMQRMEIHDLKQSIETLTAANPAAAAPQAASAENRKPTDGASNDAEEIIRLRAQVTQLTAEIAQLEKLRAENQNLHTRLAAPADTLTAEESDALNKARERAERIACVNNLKQIGLAIRIWAGDNAEAAPPDFLSMSNELGTAKILVCPADHGREIAQGFSSFSAANCSYEYFIAGSTNWEADPERIMTRCPIHLSVGLCDGSVMQLGTNRVDRFVERDGKMYLKH